MTPYLQAKLLRAVEKQEVEHLGSTKAYKVDIRVVSTTNRVMDTQIKEGKFREDLYFRLAQIHIQIPPLRERKEDIAVLVDYVLHGLAKDKGNIISVSDEARGVLLQYKWPGNVRELIGIMKRAAVMCENEVITVDDLPLHLRGDYSLASQSTYSDRSLEDAISELEKNMIVDALKKTQVRRQRRPRYLVYRNGVCGTVSKNMRSIWILNKDKLHFL
jgi:transcriptional regulator with PAS, ATPase and Fis domain